MKFCVLVGVILVLSGCATQAQQKHTLMMSTFNEGMTLYSKCVDDVDSTTGSELKDVLSIDKGAAAIKFFMNTDKPTAIELEQFAQRADAMDKCNRIKRDTAFNMDRAIGVAMVECDANTRDLQLEVLSGSLTWGVINKKAEENLANCLKRLNSAQQAVENNLEYLHAAEQQERAERGTAAGRVFQQMQSAPPVAPVEPRIPVQTNCTKTLTGMNCSSY